MLEENEAAELDGDPKIEEAVSSFESLSFSVSHTFCHSVESCISTSPSRAVLIVSTYLSKHPSISLSAGTHRGLIVVVNESQ